MELYLHSAIHLNSIALNYVIKDKGEVIGFEVFKAATMENSVFWDVEPCGSCKNRCFGVTFRLHLQGINTRERKMLTFMLLTYFFCPEDARWTDSINAVDCYEMF
jgi:hypothetical protein